MAVDITSFRDCSACVGSMDVPATIAFLESLEAPIKQLTHSVHLEHQFDFPTLSCCTCNGYYGPNYGEPVCSTCHAFLFPDPAEVFPTPLLSSEKTDDGDSGNDEPTDLNYANERRLNNQQNGGAPLGLPDQIPNNNNNDEEISNENIPFNYKNAISSYSLPNVEQRLELLSTPRIPEQEKMDLVQNLPPEVLLAIFSYLDDISLCSVRMVCRQWNDLLKVTYHDWENYTTKRWPLFKPLVNNRNWFKIYRSLMTSSFCYTCLVQMAIQSQPVEEENYGNSWRRHRLRNELKIMHNDPPEGIAAIPLDDKYCHWQATITGPIGSPYEGGLFYLYIQVPYSYPMKPPAVRFLTKILHPNVSRHGDIGIDSIQHNWSLALTISKVLISVQSLLTDPYTKICMEPTLGNMYNSDRKKFEHLARQWTWKYAMHDSLF